MNCPRTDKTWHASTDALIPITDIADEFPRWMCGRCGWLWIETPGGLVEDDYRSPGAIAYEAELRAERERKLAEYAERFGLFAPESFTAHAAMVCEPCGVSGGDVNEQMLAEHNASAKHQAAAVDYAERVSLERGRMLSAIEERRKRREAADV